MTTCFFLESNWIEMTGRGAAVSFALLTPGSNRRDLNPRLSIDFLEQSSEEGVA